MRLDFDHIELFIFDWALLELPYTPLRIGGDKYSTASSVNSSKESPRTKFEKIYKSTSTRLRASTESDGSIQFVKITTIQKRTKIISEDQVDNFTKYKVLRCEYRCFERYHKFIR